MSNISNRLSKIFRPAVVIPQSVLNSYKHDGISTSQRLMLELGLIKQANPGSFTLLPLTIRSLDKLIKLVENTMQELDAQKVHFPSVTNRKLWETSGRLATLGPELFQLKDRHERGFVLSPTHEESAADFLSTLSPLSYKEFPLLLYQISTKYRDEIKPRFGLIRGRQFMMKDLYSFDLTKERALHTYERVGRAYNKLFSTIGVDFIKAMGASGPMGGNLSHEYHYLTDVGEDKIVKCLNCEHTVNLELTEGDTCRKCSSKNVEIRTCIEVGHTFLLEEKYTKPFKVTFLNQNGKPEVLQMGSYGLGITRIIAAAIEVLSKTNEIRWPMALAPYSVVIISPKAGSKEESGSKRYSGQIYTMLDSLPDLTGDVLWDDRTSLTIGKRSIEARRMGYPFVIVIGSKSVESPPKFEVLNVNTDETMYFSMEELFNYFQQLNVKINIAAINS